MQSLKIRAEKGEIDAAIDELLLIEDVREIQLYSTAEVYYQVTYCDDDGLVPELRAYVFLRTEVSDGVSQNVFQAAEMARADDET